MYQVSEAWHMRSYPQKPNTTGKERHFHAEDGPSNKHGSLPSCIKEKTRHGDGHIGLFSLNYG